MGIIEERERGGAFKSFYDFIMRVPGSVLNKQVLESLIRSGAFDSFGHTRAALMAIYDEFVKAAGLTNTNRQSKQLDLFAEDSEFEKEMELDVPEMKEFPVPKLLMYEKELMGLFISGHPLENIALEKLSSHRIARLVQDDLSALRRLDGKMVTVAGLMSGLKVKTSKNGKRFATFAVEDMEASIDCIIFSTPQHPVDEGFSTRFGDGVLLKVKGRYEITERNNGMNPQLSVYEISLLADDSGTGGAAGVAGAGATGNDKAGSAGGTSAPGTANAALEPPISGMPGNTPGSAAEPPDFGLPPDDTFEPPPDEGDLGSPVSAPEAAAVRQESAAVSEKAAMPDKTAAPEAQTVPCEAAQPAVSAQNESATPETSERSPDSGTFEPPDELLLVTLPETEVLDKLPDLKQKLQYYRGNCSLHLCIKSQSETLTIRLPHKVSKSILEEL
jgi:hypothetical protein